MGAPLHVPGIRGAEVYTFGTTEDFAVVREWKTGARGILGYTRTVHHGWFAFWRTPEGIQIVYAGSHPADISRGAWQEWFGEQELEFWNAARRPLTITSHPLKGAVH